MKKLMLTAISAICVSGMALAGAEADPKERIKSLTAGDTYQMAQNCSGAGSKYCYPGSIASGGCYNPGYSRCWEGMICPIGFRICTVDQKGYPTPYCYEPSKPNTCRE